VIRRDDRVRDAIRRQALLLTRHPASAAASDVEAVARTLEVDHPTGSTDQAARLAAASPA